MLVSCNFNMFCFLVITVLRFALLPYYQRVRQFSFYENHFVIKLSIKLSITKILQTWCKWTLVKLRYQKLKLRNPRIMNVMLSGWLVNYMAIN